MHVQGQWWYNGAGYSHIVGCPISMFMSTMAFMGLGGLYSQPGRSTQPPKKMPFTESWPFAPA
jgi:hypothetical protein